MVAAQSECVLQRFSEGYRRVVNTAAIFVVTPRRGGAVDGAARAVFELKTCSPPTRRSRLFLRASEDYTF
jgi:hypothetical protein